MSQIKFITCISVFAFSLSLSGCGDTDSQAVFSAASGKHPTGWETSHKNSVNADTESCFECHGENLAGGISGISCTSCHLGTANIHPDQWGQYAYARHKAYVATNGTARCANAACHGTALSGVPGSGSSCLTACHMGGAAAKHPATWTQYSSHANYVKANANDHAKCSTAACHGTASNGVFLSGPSCTQCHLGGINAVHPATANAWTSAHQGHLLPDLTLQQTRAKCDIAACHGTFNDATKPGQVKVNKAACGGSCHAGDKN